MPPPPPPRDSPEWIPQKSIFWTAQFTVPVCFGISRYLTDKYLDIVWGCHPTGTPPNRPLKNNLLLWYQFYDISRDLTDKYFDIVWGCHPPWRLPQMDPPRNQFFAAQLWVPVCFDISRDLTDKYFGIVWGCPPPEDPQMYPSKINFLNGPS